MVPLTLYQEVLSEPWSIVVAPKQHDGLAEVRRQRPITDSAKAFGTGEREHQKGSGCTVNGL